MRAAALGLSLSAARSPVVFDVVRLLGAAYLVHLGIRAVSAARRAIRQRRAGRAETCGAGTESTGTVDLLTNVLNPKAALFFLSVLPQFVHGGGSTTRQIFFLGFLDVLIGVAYWFALVAVAARLRAFLARPTIRDRWEPATGWPFIAIGIGVAAA
ncbi:LysE family translocator [Streptomyces sp. NPDC102394]|uniref:LysE family translocator n=1 Tax=Streptomyces sp. NPDC102394 TaxID=3366167 RepID=UPI00381C5A30